MKLNLFSVPIYIDNVDLNKIKVNNKDFKKTFLSETKTSINFKNTIDEDGAKYILNKISNLIQKDIKCSYKLFLQNIWENIYEKEDYQEKHNHAGSHFSFIIYKDVEKSNTVFLNPSEYIINSFYYNFNNISDILDYSFEPSCTKGQMIVFPSFLIHMVKKHNNSCTIAGNVVIKKN